MFSAKLLIPLVVIGGGALIFTSAKATAKKKKVEEAYDLGLDKPDDTTPPFPPAVERAVPTYEITQTLFNEWWQQTEYGLEGDPGFWIKEFEDPPSGLDWIGPFPFLQFGNPDVAIATNDGALWYWDNGWHPAPKLADDYDAWYLANKY